MAKHDIALARVTARSFAAFHPDIPFFVLLTDRNDGYFAEEAEPFRVLHLADLQPPDFAAQCFRYSEEQLTFACAPLVLAHLLALGYQACCFVKRESMFFGPCTSAIEQCARQSVTLSAHHIAPVPSDIGPEREIATLLSGVYNAGFVGVSDCAEAREFLAWWQDRLAENCRHDVARGMHYDQRWLDLVPSYFPNAGVIRDPGFNVGHWCLPERSVSIGETITADGARCSLARFSGYDYDHPDRVSRHVARLTFDNIGAAAQLYRAYHAALRDADFEETRRWPYGHGRFSNGIAIPPMARLIYVSLGEERARFGDPFLAEPEGSFFRWLNGADEKDVRPRLTPLWRAVYAQRPDLQAAFPDIEGADKPGFLAWTLNSGMGEHDIAEVFFSG